MKHAPLQLNNSFVGFCKAYFATTWTVINSPWVEAIHVHDHIDQRWYQLPVRWSSL